MEIIICTLRICGEFEKYKPAGAFFNRREFIAKNPRSAMAAVVCLRAPMNYLNTASQLDEARIEKPTKKGQRANIAEGSPKDHRRITEETISLNVGMRFKNAP